MPLSKTLVLAAMSPGHALKDRLVIEPFRNEADSPKTEPASIDVHLGNRFVFLRRGRSVLQDPLQLLSHYPGRTENPEAQGTEVFLPFGTPLFVHPGQLVLGHTLE